MDWAYKPGKFTISDQIRHIAAIERYMFAKTILGKPCTYNRCGKELADGYDNVIHYFNAEPLGRKNTANVWVEFRRNYSKQSIKINGYDDRLCKRMA